MTPSPLLYKPTGAALEYCPSGTLALNPYRGICAHECYGGACYSNRQWRRWHPDDERPQEVVDNMLERVEHDAAKLQAEGFPARIHISFLNDCYAAGFEATTREVLTILKAHGLPWQVLTKRPSAALADLDLYDERCWLGATITYRDHQEGGEPSRDRRAALIAADGRGVKTWASVEPADIPTACWPTSELGFPRFFAVGIRPGLKGWNWNAADAERLRGWYADHLNQTGWYLKDSLRRLLPEGPYEGNLLSCGWRLK